MYWCPTDTSFAESFSFLHGRLISYGHEIIGGLCSALGEEVDEEIRILSCQQHLLVDVVRNGQTIHSTSPGSWHSSIEYQDKRPAMARMMESFRAR